MPIRKPNFTPPFNIVRASHVEFGVRDLNASRAFYVDCLGYLITDDDPDAIYLRAVEERNHHSIVLRKSNEPTIPALGYKVASEEDLDRAAAWFANKGYPTSFPDIPYQGRTLRTCDLFGMPLDFYYRMDQADCMLRKYATYKGARIQRIDHLNCFTPDVQASYDFYTELGFRLTEYTETDGDDPQLWAVWMHRKGNVHDLAFTNGRGPAPASYRRVDRELARHPAHLRRDGLKRLSREHGARTGPARHLERVLPLYPRSRRPPGRAVHLGLSHRRSGFRAAALGLAGRATPDAVGPSGAEILVRGRLDLHRRAGAASRCWRRSRSWHGSARAGELASRPRHLSVHRLSRLHDIFSDKGCGRSPTPHTPADPSVWRVRMPMPLAVPRTLTAAVALLAAAASSVASPAGSPAAAAVPDQVKRGEYLARAGDCFSCHTSPADSRSRADCAWTRRSAR